MSFTATVESVVDRLTAAGIQAAAVRADLNPPAVLVIPSTLIAGTKLCGTPSLRMVLELTARDSGDTSALAQLDALYAAVEPVMRRDLTSDPGTFTRVQSSTDPTGLPALRLFIETRMTD